MLARLYDTVLKTVYNIIFIGYEYTKEDNIFKCDKMLTFGRKICISSTDDFDIETNLSDEFLETKPLKIHLPTNAHFKSNTSPNLEIGEELPQIKKQSETKSTGQIISMSELDLPVYNPDWYCRVCKRKLLAHTNIYCCNDNIFCTPNCRDRYLYYFSSK